jgi:hypothetical protein
MSWQFERVTCPECGRRISAWVPHAGDGTDVKIKKHRDRRRVSPGFADEWCRASGRLLGEYQREQASR